MSTEKWREDNADKVKKYKRDYLERNRKVVNKRNKDRIKLLREWLREYKSTLKCAKCGEDNPATLDFHHLDPSEKELNIGSVISKGWGKDRILKEVEKCVVLCANCHRKEHCVNKDSKFDSCSRNQFCYKHI